METQHGNFTKADVDALLSRLKQFADSLSVGEREALNLLILGPAKLSAEYGLKIYKIPGIHFEGFIEGINYAAGF